MLYDGVNAVQELSGTTPVVNRLTGGVDEFFGRTDSGGTTFPLTDALGSTIALTDSSGAIQTQYTYEPFGATTPTGATSANWYQFTGRANDGTGLYYYRARYYSPRFQRFISEDPIGFNGGINEYAYALESPANYRDPAGQQVGEGVAVVACLADPVCAVALGALGVATVTEPWWGPRVANWASHAASSADDADAPPDAQTLPIPDNPTETAKDKCPPQKPKWPGWDPTRAPEGFEWRGAPGSQPGDPDGTYYNPDTDESLYPDLNHPAPKGPHWDYWPPNGGPKVPIFPDE